MKIKFLRDMIPIIFIAVNVILAVLLIVDFKVNYELSLKLKVTQDKISSFKKAKTTIERFKEKEVDTQEDALKLKLPEDTIVPLSAIREAVEIAKALGIKDVSVYPKSEFIKGISGVPGVEIVPFELKLNCEYSKVLDFINALSKSSYLLQVSGLEIIRNNSRLPNLSAAMVINTYTILTAKDKPPVKAKSKASPGKTP